jgi:hypothetical protein
MKHFFVTLVFALVFISGLSAQAQKTFVKSVPIETASVMELQLQGEVAVKEWDRDFIRVSVSVDLLNSSEEVLKRLAKLGRYDLQFRKEGATLFVEMPKMKHTVSTNGVELQEQLKIELFVPSGFFVNIGKNTAESF